MYIVAVYPTIDAPPVDVGALHRTVTTCVAATAVATTDRGAEGAPTGVTPGDAELATEVPAAFVAFTVKVYDVPFLRPVTTHVRAPVVVHVFAVPLDVTVYPVMGEPPLLAGASHDTVTCPLPATPVTPPGAVGTVRGVDEEVTAADDPMADVATSETV